MALVSNKKAHFNYEFVEEFDAGIELLGSEVKSLKKGAGSLAGAYIILERGEAYIKGMTISPYQPGNMPEGYDQTRTRKLLLTKKELNKLIGASSEQGLTIVPISVYNKGNKLKLKLALARGKKKFDKRQTIKKRESERDVRRTLKDF